MNELPYGIALDDIGQYGDAVIELATYYSPNNYENDGLTFTYPWLEADGGWRKLADWLSGEDLNVRLRTRRRIVGIRREAFPKAHLLKKNECYGLTISMNKEDTHGNNV